MVKMPGRKIAEGISEVGVRDKDKKLFDELIPLPKGTSYNAYIVKGKEKTVLIDTVDTSKQGEFMQNLRDINYIDYVIANHAEQDHTGALIRVLEKYKDAKVLTNSKCKEFLIDLLHIDEKRIMLIEDRDEIDLGGRRIQFIMAPWVHWPETMLTYAPDDKILFTCDLFGSHIAMEEVFSDMNKEVYSALKRYYAEIMMPFRDIIKNHMKKIRNLDINLIAPSHGPVHVDPETVFSHYEDWISENVKNEVVIPFVSMHGSTAKMVEHFAGELEKRGIKAKPFDLPKTDIGELAISVVDCATIVFSSPVLNIGPHPALMYAAYFINMLRPKTRFASIIGSYGWAETETRMIKSLIPNLKADMIEPVMAKGNPSDEAMGKIAKLAEEIERRHREAGIM